MAAPPADPQPAGERLSLARARRMARSPGGAPGPLNTLNTNPVETDSVIPQPEGAPTAPAQAWPPQALALAEQLQRSLAIGDRDWHALKTQRCRRGVEQIAAALVLLLARDQPSLRQPTQARHDAIALLEHAIGWLKAELSDPGCPSHGR